MIPKPHTKPIALRRSEPSRSQFFLAAIGGRNDPQRETVKVEREEQAAEAHPPGIHLRCDERVSQPGRQAGSQRQRGRVGEGVGATAARTGPATPGEPLTACINAQDGGVIDLYALRHTFVTNLVAVGVMPKGAKELARHSPSTLPMDRYTHVSSRQPRRSIGWPRPTGHPPVGAGSGAAPGVERRARTAEDR